MNPVLLAALQLARRLRHCSVREEHLFLAALETPEARLAVPVDLAAIESAVRSAVDVQMGVDTYSDPSLHLVDGRALGLALASGLADAAAEHVVVASLWEPQGACALILEGTGGSRPEVLGRLGRLGELAPSTVRVNPLVRPAFDAAAGAGDDFVGDHHILMSVLDGRPDARAKGFMAGIAVDAAGFVRWYEGERRGWGPAPVRSFEGEPAPSAACFELFGRAEGWAAPGEIGSAEALVAYLWRPSGANLGWLGPPGLTPR
ncbi:MAG: Clp protease N-terminal domain-containing protein, partial [Acidimicrobiales bacterium]